MTRGAEPQFAPTPYAQWIKQRLDELGWLKQDLSAKVRDESDGRLADAGATRLVLRATQGANISTRNRELIAQILGSSEAAETQERDLSARLAALEAAVQSGSKEVAAALAGMEAAIEKLSARIQREAALSRKAAVQ